jgi:hypothetical protein
MAIEDRETRFGDEIGRVLRGGPSSTTDARARIMDAVRVEPRPRRPARIVALGRGMARHPGLGLLAAASVAAVIALTRTVSVEGTPEPIPGVGATRASAPRVAAELPGPGPVTPAAGRTVAEDAIVPVQFVLVQPKAKRVSVVGDFNDWDPAATPLESSAGVWTAEVGLPTGPQSYAFVVDESRWIADPGAPRAPADELSSGYSMIVVGGKQ